MAEINANFVVQPFNITVTPDAPGISVTATPTNLNVYSLGYAQPSGNVGELQFNLNGQSLGGAANTLASNGNVRFTNISNLKIDGGANAYFLQTDGTGNLTWAQGTANVSGNGTAAGANTQIQISDGTGNFTSAAGFTFDNATNLFSTPGNVFIAGDANIVGNIANANITNALVGNTANFSGNVAANNFTGNAGNFAGNVSANYFIGNGSQLTGVSANLQILDEGNILGNTISSINFVGNGVTATSIGNAVTVNITGQQSTIFNGTSNVNIPTANGNVNISANGTANIVTVASTLTSSLVTINGNLDACGTANITTLNVGIGGLSVNGNANVGNLGATLITGTLTTNSQPNITTVGTLGNLDVTGNINAGNITANFNIRGPLSNGTSNVRVFLNSNVSLSANGVANVVAISSDTATINANVIVNNAFTYQGNAQGLFSANASNLYYGEVPASRISGNYTNAAGSNINNLQANIVIGNTINSSSLIYFSEQIELLASNLKFRTAATDRLILNSTAANFTVPIITSGNITANNANITNNVVANNASFTEWANANNITVTANISAGNVKTDNLLYANGAPYDLEQPGGTNTNIQFNDANDFGGSNAFTFDKSTNAVALTGNLSASNANLGNAVNANYFIGNLNGQANTAVSATTAGTVTTNAQPNITSVGNLTDLRIDNTKIHLGNGAGNGTQGNSAIAIGDTAGFSSQGDRTVAIGYSAGYNAQGSDGVAIGYDAGNTGQGSTAVAIGARAGETNTGIGAIAVGYRSGSTGKNYSIALGYETGGNAQTGAIAIGHLAGQGLGNNSIAIGANASRNTGANNTIVLNATGSNLEATNANIFIVKPIRNTSSANLLYYNPISGEISYDVLSNTISVGNANANTNANFCLLYIAGNTTGNFQAQIDNFGSELRYNPFQQMLMTTNYVGDKIQNDGSVGAGACESVVLDGSVEKVLISAGTVANVLTIGNTGANVSGTFNVTGNANVGNIKGTYVLTTAVTAAALGNANTIGIGARAFVTDANTNTFNNIVYGGGSNNVPVFSDGTNWRIG